MRGSDPIHAYSQLADELYAGTISETELRSATITLPVPDKKLLDSIAHYVEQVSTARPRYGWAISRVTQQAAVSQHCDLYLQSLTAWSLARACNHWSQPKRMQEAIALARHGFESLNENGWLAACEWQENALAWTKPNFAESARVLKDALHGLESNGFAEFIPECRLALAFAQILIGQHAEALENIHLSEEVYRSQGDQLNQARCWLNQASSLRRQGHFEGAFQKLQQALSIFERENSLTDQAKAHYQIALCLMLQANDLPRAVKHFQQAADLFDATELDLWRSACINNLGSVYMINGQLNRAKEYYQEAGDNFSRHEVQGPLADNLNDRGKLNVLLGKPALSIEQFKQSAAINTMLGSKLSAAIVISNLGEAYGQLGRYQDALHHLERAAEQLESLENYSRLAACEKYVALIWLRLGQPQTALEYLDKSFVHYEMADQKAFLASVYNYRAAAFFQQGQVDQAIASLEQSLTLAEKFGIRPQFALAKRLLGEALVCSSSTRQAESLKYLEQAHSDFTEMKMLMEQAACLIAIGAYCRSIAEAESAKTAFEEALQLSEGTFPEIDWRAYIELGNLAESQGDTDLALRMYHKGTETFHEIRQNFLQPALAGSYLQTPARVFDQIVAVASRAAAALETLSFIEESKASTLTRHLSETHTLGSDSTSQELDEIKVDIDLLKRQLKASLEDMPALQSAFQSRQTRKQLKRKIEQYSALKTRLERRSLSDEAGMSPSTSFDLEGFRQMTGAFLGEDWIALDYYLNETELTAVMVTPHDCIVYSQPVSKRFVMALNACDKARRNAGPPQQSDLEILGNLLIPDSLADHISPDTHLLLAPHRNLHQIPWSAVQPGFATQPLVCLCTPSVIPSLHGLRLLWERGHSIRTTNRGNGLLVGLSSFNGLQQELPQVRNEITALASKLHSGGFVLTEEEATWMNLLKLKGQGELTDFGWLHIASHFSSDRVTGRLSGIALQDGEIWLDQLRDLSPLPALVSLSACNSNDSFLYEGDERVDLQTTCLMAGAQSVIGSVWPVLDQSAAELTSLFYDYYLEGSNPAKAAAAAQRQFIQAGKELNAWASFICAGLP